CWKFKPEAHMDTIEYKDLFISESLEHLDRLNQALLSLEKNTADRNSLNEIFRTSHTLKGMAATMGFDQITELTHQMENVLDKLRTSQQDINSEIVDVLFECLDTLGLLIEEISSAEAQHIDISALTAKLAKLGAGKPDQAAAPQAKPDPEKAKAGPAAKSTNNKFFASTKPAGEELNVEHLEEILTKAEEENYIIYGVKVRVEPTCTFKGVRAFMVYKALSEHGEMIASFPDPQALQEGSFELEFLLLLLSQRKQELLQRSLKGIAEIESFEVEQLSPGQIEAFFGDTKAKVKMLVAAPESSKEQKKQGVAGRAIQSIRVSIERLDNLQNLVGELVINKIRLTQISKQYGMKELKEALIQFDRITNDLQDEVTEVRMVPMEHIFNRFPRMVRDLAKESHKEIELYMEGKDIELDRTVLDEINDPLVHLLRNAVDHGIERPETRLQQGKSRQGSVRLVAMREKNHVIIKVTDDGMGIDPVKMRRVAVERGLLNIDESERLTDQEAVNLVSLPGFTTATVVTEVSGRGVGVDAVRTKIESFGGSLRIESKPGEGSAFILRMPMTLAIIQALLFSVGKEVYALPVINTVETIEFVEQDVKFVQQGEVVVYRDSVLPLMRLHRLLEVPGEESKRTDRAVLVTEVGEMRVGLLVDQVLGQQEIAIKSLGQMLKSIKGFSGVTILGDGRVSLVLDVPSLL
ncbi:chemotaxis protein CheA, partial [candidate division FCPU426 bacterium]|nr:chemotaxis protein CheA [candidate division FCPU426 bacterium]